MRKLFAKIHIFLVILILLLPFGCFSQEDICIGKRYSLVSKTLGEEREYWIHLPDSYTIENEKNYPVIYLLDASNFFHSLIGIQRTFYRSRIPIMPECIIVGVISGKNRMEDFTPTKSSFQRDGKILSEEKAVGGGSKRFTTFLGEELRSVIDQNYRTNKQNTLIGHSLSGLFTVGTLLYHSDLFLTYIAFDPSLWWDDQYIIKQAETIFKQKDMSGISLYVAYGGKLRPDQKTLNPSAMNAFIDILPLAKENGLSATQEAFPDDNHGSIFTSAIGKALKAVPFSDFPKQ